MPGSPGPEVLGLTYSIMLAPHALQSLQGALGLECHLRSPGPGEGAGGGLYLLILGKERQPGDRASWGKQHPMVQSCAQAVSLRHSPVPHAASSWLEPVEGKDESKHRQAWD